MAELEVAFWTYATRHTGRVFVDDPDDGPGTLQMEVHDEDFARMRLDWWRGAEPRACGMTTPDTARCSCGHLISVHDLKESTKAGKRTKYRSQCTHFDANGPCPCPGPR